MNLYYLDDSAWLEAKDRCIMINAAEVSELYLNPKENSC